MASTRNINSRGDYSLEQNYYGLARIYNNYTHSAQGLAYTPTIPEIGITPGHMPRGTLSNNPIEIESMLFGIGSTNLVKPQKPIKPDLKQIPSSKFFDRLIVHMPKPLVMEKDQRPYPI
jgi:hypothetical protein